MKMQAGYKSLLHTAIIAAIALIAYSNTFNAPFQFDDKEFIADNPVVKDLKLFFEPSKSSETGERFEYGNFKMRCVGYLSFALNYKMHGLDVTGYHIFNLAVHISNAVLVYFFVRLIFMTPFIKRGDDGGSGKADLIALFAALLFAVHPVQTQAVTYIWQRITSLAAMFCLLSIVSYIKWRLSNQKIEDRSQNKDKEFGRYLSSESLFSVFYYLSSVVCAMLAMKTKEIAFTLPVIIVVCEFMFFSGSIRKRILYLMPLVLTMLIIPAGMLDIDKPAGALISDVSATTRVQTEMSRGDYLFTQFRVIVTYIRLLLFPVNQNLDYDYPVYRSFFDPGVALSFVFLLTLFALAVYLLWRSHSLARRGHELSAMSYERIISFGILWFFIALSVESSVIPIVDVIFEHRAYLPSAGFFIALSASVFMFAERFKLRRLDGRAMIAASAVIIFVLTAMTYARNAVWQTEIRLWEDVVSKSPYKWRGYSNLCSYYFSANQADRAFNNCNRAIALNPFHANAYITRGDIYSALGIFQLAAKDYEKAVFIRPDKHFVYNNLGNAYAKQGLHDKAIENFTKAINLNPYAKESYFNRGALHASVGAIEKALNDFKTACDMGDNVACDKYNNLYPKHKQDAIPGSLQD